MSYLSVEELSVIKAALEKEINPTNTAITLWLKVKYEIDKRLGF